MRLTVVILIACFMQVSASSLAQKITLNKSKVSLKAVFKDLKEQSGYNFFYTDNLLKDAIPVDVNVKNAELEDVLLLILDKQHLNFIIRDKTVVIKRKEVRQDIISGFVGDKKDRKPIPGVTVSIKGTKSMVQTDKNGKFTISVPTGAKSLEFKYLGYKTVELAISPNSDYTIYLTEDEQTLNETVITGMMERKASTYTGAAKTMTATELKQVSPTNVFTAIAALDPSFRIVPNNVTGGNINALPEIQMRGQNSFPTLGAELAGNPNQPLFMLDGFEVRLQDIVDLDMNLIASITLLKDAAATATYGSRGANGVMVVTTIVPPSGKIEVSLTNNFTLNTPDLSVYDLLNSREKLDFERRAGLVNSYGTEYIYNEHYKAMLSGVNTDWKSIPVQTGFNNRTSLGLRGGDDVLRFNLNFSGNLLQGVMKGQDRKNYQGSFQLSYTKKKFLFQNQITATQVVSNASPYGSFSDYLNLNPYLKPYGENGEPTKYLENIFLSGSTGENSVKLNPLMDITYNTIDNRDKNFTIRNATSVRYNATKSLFINAGFNLSKVNGQIDNFHSALDSEFAAITDLSRKGKYSIRNNNSFRMEGNASANYSQTYGLHSITGNALFNISSDKSDTYTMVTEGFPYDRLDHVLFAAQYEANSKPVGAEATNNRVSYSIAANYSYDNRYFSDVSFTREGSSAYGANNKYGTFWSTGIGWNLHNESFLKDSKFVNRLRVRGSYGSTGSLAVDPYQSQFRYNFGNTTSYYGEIGASIAGLGNPDLSWQQVLKTNIGIEAALYDNRINFRAELYNEVTQNALTTVSIAPSTGFNSYSENLGKLQNRGLQLELGYAVLNDPSKGLRWVLTGTAATNKNILKELSNQLKAFNERLNKDNPNQTVPNPQFIEGQSTTAFYAVPSLGVDPITGKEVFMKLDGSTTFDWDVRDKVYSGDTRPTWTGNLNSNFLYKGFGFNFSLTYNYGAVLYNSTLVNRVEAVNPRDNVDRRAYELGWKGPGDVSQYQRITSSNQTKLTSRFVQKDNNIEIGSVNFSYQFNNQLIRKLGLQNLTVNATTTNAINFRTIQIERGTENPFAREYTLGLTARF
ncbi:MAG: SusC/RagA family TonB-linked outer membrane protein [Pedobacter sp.]|uniref:SusC/RagA family TonB-linked outer membrane protein n=1 Tax=Pedobacter sp. TaxID=1411316 RepID=UPI0035673029